MLKKLKSLFVVEEEMGMEEKLSQAASGNNSTTNKKDEPIITESTEEIFEANVSEPAKPQKKFTDILLKAMDKENLEGNDYLEFKQSLKSLASVIDDEETRYKSSFAVMKSSGVNKEKLISSNTHYVNVLKSEKAKFEQTFKAQQTKQIQAREEKIKKFTKGIDDRKKQLQKLINEIEKMEKDLEKSKVEINKVAGKVQLTRDQFMASYNLILEQLKADSTKINQYIS